MRRTVAKRDTLNKGCGSERLSRARTYPTVLDRNTSFRATMANLSGYFFYGFLALLMINHAVALLAFLPVSERRLLRPAVVRFLATNAEDGTTKKNHDPNSDEDEDDRRPVFPIDTSLDDRLYRVRLSRAAGIEWGTDLSFSFVYVRGLDPSGDAAASGQVEVGDQLCELNPVVDEKATGDKKDIPFVNLIGAPFDMVMTAFAELDRSVRAVDLVFFRGTKNELKTLASNGAAPERETITVTVIAQKGSPEETTTTLTAPAGVNVRKLLVDNGINVYQSVTRWTNCKGKQLCGTCIVNMRQGLEYTNRKSIDEASTLRENPDSYRLACVTFAYDDITVETFPPVSASQWTR
jgi:ferredoxin